MESVPHLVGVIGSTMSVFLGMLHRKYKHGYSKRSIQECACVCEHVRVCVRVRGARAELQERAPVVSC